MIFHHIDLARDKIHIAAVKNSAVEPSCLQTIGLPRIVGGITRTIRKLAVRIIAQHDTVRRHAFFAVLLRHEIHITAVKYRTKIPTRRQAADSRGIKGIKTNKNVWRGPLGNKRLQPFLPRVARVDPSFHRQSVG